MCELRATVRTFRGGVWLFIVGGQLSVGVEDAGGMEGTLGKYIVTHGGAIVEADGEGAALYHILAHRAAVPYASRLYESA